MNKLIKIYLSIFFILSFSSISFGDESFFKEGVKLYEVQKYDEAKFLFERSIVLNPKDSSSYLYLAKIYNQKDDQIKEEKNLETTLLIEPRNEAAILMLMKVALAKTNYSKVQELSQKFTKFCKKLCNQNEDILKELSNLEPKNES
jgi:tetratricopeptide (TPR) repeat protein